MIKFITYAYLRSECDISTNIEDKVLDNKIKMSQNMLRMILGTAFYQEIETQNPISSTNTLTADNLALYDPYLKQFIAWQAYEYWIIKANFAETKSGIRVHTEENSEIASDKQMGELIAMSKRQAQMYKGYMMSYLKESQANNSGRYPLYGSCGSDHFGSGIHITAVKKRDTTYCRINRESYGGY